MKAKQLVEGLIGNFERYYEKGCGVEGVERVEGM